MLYPMVERDLLGSKEHQHTFFITFDPELNMSVNLSDNFVIRATS